ncbi:hypothetical protein FFT87_08020 [Salinibacterium sp. M195]|nr:hypothetical protein FFT87_08020 [Salinibacterium sp. M195]
MATGGGGANVEFWVCGEGGGAARYAASFEGLDDAGAAGASKTAGATGAADASGAAGAAG